jgi:carboxymethylenebutenolidase
MTDFDELPIPGEHSATPVRAYVKVPDGAHEGVVLLHAWWGLNGDAITYADRLATKGFGVLAPDMFGGRIATTPEDAERLAGEAESDHERIGTIALAAADHLAERLGPGSTLATLGFSFGAAWAIWLPTKRDTLASTVVYYGTWVDSVLEEAMVPVLGHFAEEDRYETAETVDEFERRLRAAGRLARIHRYPGTGHWFAEPSRDAYRRDAAELAFERTAAFLREVSGG